MITKGLKVGDTFTDGGYEYKITSVCDNGNYISSLVGKASEGVKTPKVEVVEVAEDKPLEDIDYASLKKMAKEKGISAKGSKEEVIERLRGI